MDANRDDQPISKPRRMAQDIEVAVCHRIERTGVKCCAEFGHG